MSASYLRPEIAVVPEPASWRAIGEPPDAARGSMLRQLVTRGVARFGLVAGLLVAALALSGCAGGLRYLDEEARLAAREEVDAPHEIALVTVVIPSGLGMHSALMVNGSQRVMYDPAGGWIDRDNLSHGDLRYAMTPERLSRYLAYHTRRGRKVFIQRRMISAAQADAVIAQMETREIVPTGFCAIATRAVLRSLPGNADLPLSLSPVGVMREYARGRELRTEVVDPGGIRMATPADTAWITSPETWQPPGG